MAYFVDVSASPAASFLEQLSPPMRKALEDSLELHLGQMGDHFCLTESYRIRGTSEMEIPLILMDPDARRPRSFRVIVSDASAPSGVLRALYLDEVTA